MYPENWKNYWIWKLIPGNKRRQDDEDNYHRILRQDVTKYTGCVKKTLLKEMCDFLTLKMLPLALALIKTKNRHLFAPLVKKCPFS